MNQPQTIHPHGDYRRYAYNRCRCERCRAAHAEETRRIRRLAAYGRWTGWVDALGTIRRLRALATIGWSFTYIAGRRGIDPSAVRETARGEHPKVRAETAYAYAVLYEELADHDGPAKQTRGWARKYGWAGPDAWTDQTIGDPDAQPYEWCTDLVDEVAVELALRGDRQAATRLTPAEIQDLLRIADDRGLSNNAVAAVLGTSVRRTRTLRDAARRSTQDSEAAA